MTATLSRRALLAAPKTIEWERRPLPSPAAGEVLVRVRAALTCGTDLKTYRRGHPKLAFGPFGHEASGDIVAVGEGVTAFESGDPVMWVQTAPCGACAQCAAGLENLCDRLTEDMALGAYGEHLVLPAKVVARNLFPKPERLRYIEAAFLEPLSCVVHGWRMLRRADGERPVPAEVAIVGAGTIGLLHASMAVRAGARPTVVARRPESLEAAVRAGAATTACIPDGAVPHVAVGRRFPAVIECGGTAESWCTAVDLCANGGRVLLFSGLAPGAQIELDAGRIHYGEISLVGSFHFTPADVREARDLLAANALTLDRLVSGIEPLAALGDVFERLDRREGSKFALIPEPEAPRWL